MVIILDINLGKLAKWLRMLGYDARLVDEKEIENYFQVSGVIFFTKNNRFYEKTKDKIESVYLPFDHLETQLSYLYRLKKIEITEDFLKRCSICNVPLESIEKKMVKDNVPPFVYNNYDEFMKCPKCGKIYWNATHIDNIKRKLMTIFDKKNVMNIGLTAGDINGIGSQIILKLFLKRKELFRQKRIFIIGSLDVLKYYQSIYKRYSRKIEKIKFQKVTNTKEYFPGLLNVFDIGLRNKEKIKPGRITKDSGEVTYRILERSRELFLNGDIDLVVTAPNSKEALNLAGHHLTGATEFYESGEHALMTFFSDEMILALQTRHIPIKDVSEHLKTDDIIQSIDKLSVYGKVGVLGLNPHAGENGIIGNEEKKIIVPAIEFAQKNGLNVAGPLVPDTFFHEKCDVYLSMYHDQLLPLFKKLYFDRSFQASLGITIKRVSVNHGTAWDKVENYGANCHSLEFIFDKGLELIKWV